MSLHNRLYLDQSKLDCDMYSPSTQCDVSTVLIREKTFSLVACRARLQEISVWFFIIISKNSEPTSAGALYLFCSSPATGFCPYLWPLHLITIIILILLSLLLSLLIIISSWLSPFSCGVSYQLVIRWLSLPLPSVSSCFTFQPFIKPYNWMK